MSQFDTEHNSSTYFSSSLEKMEDSQKCPLWPRMLSSPGITSSITESVSSSSSVFCSSSALLMFNSSTSGLMVAPCRCKVNLISYHVINGQLHLYLLQLQLLNSYSYRNTNKMKRMTWIQMVLMTTMRVVTSKIPAALTTVWLTPLTREKPTPPLSPP